jgi:DNA polymerase elongation subunit (family B)
MSQKTETKQGGKRRVIKKPNWKKMRKYNKTLSYKKSEKGQIKNTIKEKELKKTLIFVMKKHDWSMMLTYLLCHFVLNIFFYGALTRKCHNQLRKGTNFHKVI